MEYILENEKAKLIISSHAAEIHSFTLKDKPFEYMWQGDPAYWAGRNPILFPQVNCVSDHINIYKGKEYTMGNHGFARNSEFDCVSHSDDTLVLSLRENEETLLMYPYRFELKVTYTLEETTLFILYEITNNNEEDMPFGFGLHPAFACPVDPSKKMEDYEFLFDEDEDVPFIENRRVRVSHGFLDPDDKFIPERKSHFISMSDGENGVRVEVEGWKMVMFWSKPGASYACIEPWMFTQKKDELGIPFEKKKDVLILGSGEHFMIGTSYRIF